MYILLKHFYSRTKEFNMTDYYAAVALWSRKNIKNEAELSEALNETSISFAYHSGKIENDNITYYDTREIFNHDGVTSYTGDLRTLYEIRNAKNAYECFLRSFGCRNEIDEIVIKNFQEKLTEGTYDMRQWQLGERPGEYKHHDYVTGRNETGASPEEVKEEMDELLSEISGIRDGDALTAAAYFHAKFENIHPFADGNGRCGRLVMNYFLVMHNHPPVVIHEEDRKQYYDALSAWDEKQELSPLINFLKEQTVKTWIKQLERRKTRDINPER